MISLLQVPRGRAAADSIRRVALGHIQRRADTRTRPLSARPRPRQAAAVAAVVAGELRTRR